MRLAGVWSAAVLGLMVLLSTLRGATVGDRLSYASIALRYGGTKILIVGDLAENGALQSLTAGGLDRFPALQIDAILSPGWATLEITSKVFRGLEPKVKVRAGFDVGARWELYPGAGSPTTIVVEKLVLLYHADGNSYLGALARILDADMANRIAGLNAGEYLALAGDVVGGISQVPMMRLDMLDSAVRKVLYDRGRAVVHDDNRQINDNTVPAETKRIREINHAFLSWGEYQALEAQVWRWAPVGGSPLLFVEVVWYDEKRRETAVFAADAIVQELPVLKVLSFNYEKGGWMRMGEFNTRDWRLDRNHGAFLNAWRAGSEDFVLTFESGYEGYSVELQKLDFVTGLTSVFGFGE